MITENIVGIVVETSKSVWTLKTQMVTTVRVSRKVYSSRDRLEGLEYFKHILLETFIFSPFLSPLPEGSFLGIILANCNIRAY